MASNIQQGQITWNVPIVDPRSGNPTPEFMIAWQRQGAINNSINLSTAAQVSTALDLIGSVPGSLLFRSTSAWSTLTPGAIGKVLTMGSAVPEWDTPHYPPVGGTTGEVLAKNSAADYDFSWSSNAGGSLLPLMNGDTAPTGVIGDDVGQSIGVPLGSARPYAFSYAAAYWGLGTAANMPVTPNVAVGASSLYYQTDTGHTYIWSGSAMVKIA